MKIKYIHLTIAIIAPQLFLSNLVCANKPISHLHLYLFKIIINVLKIAVSSGKITPPFLKQAADFFFNRRGDFRLIFRFLFPALFSHQHLVHFRHYFPPLVQITGLKRAVSGKIR